MFIFTRIQRATNSVNHFRRFSRVWVVNNNLPFIKSRFLKFVELKKQNLDVEIAISWNNKGDKGEELNMNVTYGGTSTFKFLIHQNGENRVEIEELDHVYSFAHSLFKHKIQQNIAQIFTEIGAKPK